MAAKFDIYQEVTDRIISELEKGKIPWIKPWNGGSCCAVSHATGKPYSLLNQLLIGDRGEYMTFNQCRAEGGKIKKGSKSKLVVFWKMFPQKKEEDKPCEDNQKPKLIPVLRHFHVFNLSDCEGIEPKYIRNVEPTHNDPIASAEKALSEYLKLSGVHFESSFSDRAYYRRTTDTISVPQLDQFSRKEEYYSTVFHEVTHSTGHEKRLNRLKEGDYFGSEGYSKEELVAEIGSANILHQLGIETAETFRNSAGYIQNWLKSLKNDKRMIISAAGAAEKAVRLILNQN